MGKRWSLVVLAACGGCVSSGGGGGGGFAPAVVSGSTCTPNVSQDLCGTDNNLSAQLTCTDGKWSTAQVCPAGTFCTKTGTVFACTAGGTAGSDAITGSDGTTANDASTATDTKPGDGTSVEVGPPPDTQPLPDSIAPADTKGDTVSPKPCGGPCASGQKCNPQTNKCYAPCGGPCSGGKTCDESGGPPGVCTGGTTQGGWGSDGKGLGVQHLSSLAIGSASSGCDLTGDGQPDNAFAALGSFIGSQMSDAVAKGSLVILFDPKAWKVNGTAFTINLYTGSPDPSDANCSPTTAGCTYEVSPSSYDTSTGCTPPQCPSQVAFDNSKVQQGKLTGSAPKFPLELKLGAAPLTIAVSKVSIQGNVSSDMAWVSTKSGLLCGAISDTDLNAAIDAAPDSAFAQFGGKDQIKSLLPMLLKKDVALNGGAPDAYSIGLQFETLAAKISGVSAP